MALPPPEIDCGDIPHPQNGAVSFSDTTYNSVANYSCKTGYTLMGNASQTCLDTALWSGSKPLCTSELLRLKR